jgi:DNA-binding transcriptional MerR regulator
MGAAFPIGEVASRTGLKVPTIRYYEQIGLVPTLPRSEGNRRCYHDNDIRRLVFIRHARELGFEVGAIRTLLAMQDQPENSCGQIDALVGEHLAAIDSRIQRLVALRRELRHMLARCKGGRVAECRVIESISKCEANPKARVSPPQTDAVKHRSLYGAGDGGSRLPTPTMAMSNPSVD